MDRTAGSGLELRPPADPEVGTPHDEHKYYSEIGSSHDPRSAPPIQSKQSENYYMEIRGSNYPILAQPDDAKSKRRPSVIWVLAFVAVIGLAVALGTGLGVGLAGQHESNSPV